MAGLSFEEWFKVRFPAIPLTGAQAVLRLTEEKATIPFIARYRKEATGNLDEVAIQQIIEAKNSWDETASRKTFILEEIKVQGKLTDELSAQINSTYDLATLEDLYLPYKKKRKTKATIAKEAGLEPFADWLLAQCQGSASATGKVDDQAKQYVSAEKGIADAHAAIEGAQFIIIERISEVAELRQFVRSSILDQGYLVSSKGEKAKEHSKFELYFDYQGTVKSLLDSNNSHRYLAMKRGESEGELALKFGGAKDDTSFDDQLLRRYEDSFCKNRQCEAAKVVLQAARLSLKVYVLSSICAEIHTQLKTVADEAAIKVFSENIRALLLASPYGPKTVLGVDPGLRTGCKLALVDRSGKYISSAVIHPESEVDQARVKKLLGELVKSHQLQAIAIGNGTASRETESFFRRIIEESKLSLTVVVVSEAGASVYSASVVAREEFPDLDLTIRGAISIARRLQDPLAELVKVDPKSIGVGQYQHDVSATALKNSLERAVESCVNAVGVNLNTASQHLLAYVSGIGPSLAKAIVEHREQKGLFASRKDIMQIPRFGDKAFEQAAGFLRIPGGLEPLDNTGVHPEKYDVIRSHAERLKKSVKDLLGAGALILKADKIFREQIGEFSSEDIVKELEKPGRDPREGFVAFEFLKDVHEVKDLKPGMLCPGIVTNVTNFGAFVDIGVHQDGLVHISQLSDSFVKDPRSVVSPGMRVKARVIEVNLEKNQIALSLKTVADIRANVISSSGSTDSQTKMAVGDRRRSPAPAPQPPRDNFKNTPFSALLGMKK